ncbi:MAG: DNA repair protein RecN [Bacilli bacterium]|nr:DNA repair protein RecN [Bacilli bacterium]
MLVALNVKNFAIIDNINVDFKEGMTVLTGETGAGKSLIIDAIGLLFGKRASTDMIRSGEDKATIEGEFSGYDKEITKILDEIGIDYQDEQYLTIKREIYSSGKSVCKINNQTCNLAQLAEISEFIGDIHSQEDTIGLINPKNYLRFLNNGEIEAFLEEYVKAYSEYKANLSSYKELLKKNEESKAKEDFLKYNLKEYNQAKLDLNEEASLKQEASNMANYEKMVSDIKDINDVYNSESLSSLYYVIKSLDRLAKYDEAYLELKKNFEEAYYNLEAIFEDDKLRLSNFEYDEDRLDQINSRLAVYSDFKRKYKKDIPELISYFEDIKKELDFIENYDVYLEDAKKKLDNSLTLTYNLGVKLHNARVKEAKLLEEDVKNNLVDLELKNALFEIRFNEISKDNLYKDGLDQIDFLVTFNKGEPLKPLSKVASGGELSRFMLAIKTSLGKSLPLQTKIFDEIDHGVSGAVAFAIGKKISSIAKSSQVLCITHLPQVASIANHQLNISKYVDGNKTFSVVKELSEEERIIEIAKMISNGNVTNASIETAKELLNK